MSDFRNKIIKFAEMYKLERPGRPQLYMGSRLETRKRLEQFKVILQDELNEVDAIIEGLDAGTPTIDVQVAIADWLGDIQVYCASEMTKFGLNNDVVLDIIMESNFSKLDADGNPIVKDGKVQKGPNYWKPEPKLKEYILTAPASVGPQYSSVGRSLDDLRPKDSANERQVGGDHYKTSHGLQHWDIVAMFHLDYFQGQITKYVMRWRSKGGIQDLKKARHFMDKYIELEEAKQKRLEADTQQAVVEKVAAQNQFKPWDPMFASSQNGNEFWQNEGYYGDGTCLYSCRKCKHTTRAAAAPGVPHACPAKAAQDAS